MHGFWLSQLNQFVGNSCPYFMAVKSKGRSNHSNVLWTLSPWYYVPSNWNQFILMSAGLALSLVSTKEILWNWKQLILVYGLTENIILWPEIISLLVNYEIYIYIATAYIHIQYIHLRWCQLSKSFNRIGCFIKSLVICNNIKFWNVNSYSRNFYHNWFTTERCARLSLFY